MQRMRPRMTALMMMIGGAAVTTLMAWLLSGATSIRGKALLIVGGGGIVAGIGLTMLIWPPKQTEPADGASAWDNAPWPQRILWIVGGVAGLIAGAVAMTVMSDKY
ncbi:MAG: hypothetical protein KC609_21950 [Myxococcales bacterium]|nr:hypothetical protein [Myxococcales bacterium]